MQGTRVAISKLAKASSLGGLSAEAGESLNTCAYSDAKQRLYFFGHGVQEATEMLHFLTLSDLEQGVRPLRIGSSAGEDAQDQFYGGTRVTNTMFNSSGDLLLLSGPSGEPIPYLGLVDLRDDAEIDSLSAQREPPSAPHRNILPADLRARLLKAAWHPLSKTHIVALFGPEGGSDSGERAELRIYNVDDVRRMKTPEIIIPVDGDVASFCFGPESLWQRFTIYLVSTGLEATGGAPRLFALCPVVPFRARVPALAVKELQEAILEELALDKVARRREELETQWSFLDRSFGDVVGLAKQRGDDYLAFRWVTNRVPMGPDRTPVIQDVEYPDPPVTTAEGLSMGVRALDLLNPCGTLPALAVTFDKELVDVLLAVSLVEPSLLRGREGGPWRALEARRLARLMTGHRAREVLPRLLPDPERHSQGILYLVREQAVLRLVLPWIRRVEELGDEGGELGFSGSGALAEGRPPERARLQEVHRIGSGANAGGRGSVGACMVYGASVGSLLLVRRRDAEVEMLNLAILPFMVDEEGDRPEEKDGDEQGRSVASARQELLSARGRETRERFFNFVPFEAACLPDLERLRRGYERFLHAVPGARTNELVRLKQDLIQEVVIPLRALQTRMVVRSDEVAVLYERAHAVAKVLDERLEEQRAACERLLERVAGAEHQLEQDEKVARLAVEKLHWVRSVITPQEDRRFQEVQLAEARLRNLHERLESVEGWLGGQKADGGDRTSICARRRRAPEQEMQRRHLISQVQDLGKDVALLESVLDMDEEDAPEEARVGGSALLHDFNSLRIDYLDT